MKNIASETVRVIVDTIHPRDPKLRARSLPALKLQDAAPLQFAAHAADVLAWGYWEKFTQSFNQHVSLVQAAVVILSFAFAPPRAAFYVLGAVLVALAFRDSFTHQDEALPENQYYLDSAGDAAVAGIFVIASQGLAVVALPSMALPAQVMYRGLLVSMPLVATLRMVLRPRPAPEDSGGSTKQPRLPARKLYRKTRWLNFLWLVTVYGVVVQSVSDKHGYFPDVLRGVLPVVSFIAWKASQVDDLCRRDNLITLFTSIRGKAFRRMRGNLAAGPPQTKDVNYSTFRFFQLSLLGVIALSLFAAVEPFLFGEPLMLSIWRAAGAVLGFVAAALSWKHVKETNRAAARALLVEAREEERR
jgi:hypothetical protein